MDQHPRLQAIFTQDINIDRIVEALGIESRLPINEDTLLIFDEIQEIPLALQSLKYFHEQRPELPILAAAIGSFDEPIASPWSSPLKPKEHSQLFA